MHRLTISSPAQYRIVIRGSLDENWSGRVGMHVNVNHDDNHYPVTILTGEVLDQAMLLGVLNYMYDLGMPIVKVEWIEAEGMQSV
jgi:hypothetical protein